MPKQQTGLIQYRTLVFQKLKENYQSIVLGILVLLVAVSMVVRLSSQQKKLTRSQKTVEEVKETVADKKTYTVKKGDNLWLIAENQYGSGFNALDIAKTNNITNPDLIESGQILTIPEVAVKKPTKGLIAQAKTAEVTIKEDKYTVKKDDHLWKIALEAYGDGYQWLKIATANKLTDPDIIYAGNVLTLPR